MRLKTVLLAFWISAPDCHAPTDSGGPPPVDATDGGGPADPTARPDLSPPGEDKPFSLGRPCGAAGDCTSGFCVEGVCCDRACGDSDGCEHCATARGAEVDGLCSGGAELPRRRVEATTPPQGLAQRTLLDGESLQDVLRNARPGTEILV